MVLGVVLVLVLLGAILGGVRRGADDAPAPITTWPAESAGAQDDDAPSAAVTFDWGEPVWTDEFTGDAPAPEWELYRSAGHDGNGLRLPAQATVAGGVLTQFGTPDGRSAGMLMQGREATYGRWEARLRADQRGSGARPYHVVLALIPTSVPYAAGERDVDFAEADIGTGSVNLFLHHPPNKQDYLAIPLDLAQWHTFAVEIAPGHVTWFVDGIARATTTRPEAVPTTPLALNVQLDAYRPRDLITGRLQVDWVRHYSPPEAGARPPLAPAPTTGDYDPG